MQSEKPILDQDNYARVHKVFKIPGLTSKFYAW
jgi:hypothetical protein